MAPARLWAGVATVVFRAPLLTRYYRDIINNGERAGSFDRLGLAKRRAALLLPMIVLLALSALVRAGFC